MLLGTLFPCIFSNDVLLFLFPVVHPGVGLMDCIVILDLVFWETSVLFSTMAAPVYIVPTVNNSAFSPMSLPFVICIYFDDSHSDRCKVISLWFWFALLLKLSVLSMFSCACWSSVCLLWKEVFSFHFLIF